MRTPLGCSLGRLLLGLRFTAKLLDAVRSFGLLHRNIKPGAACGFRHSAHLEVRHLCYCDMRQERGGVPEDCTLQVCCCIWAHWPFSSASLGCHRALTAFHSDRAPVPRPAGARRQQSRQRLSCCAREHCREQGRWRQSARSDPPAGTQCSPAACKSYSLRVRQVGAGNAAWQHCGTNGRVGQGGAACVPSTPCSEATPLLWHATSLLARGQFSQLSGKGLILASKFLLQMQCALLAAEEQQGAELPEQLSEGSSHRADAAATTVAAEASSSSEDEPRGASRLQLIRCIAWMG